MVHAHHRDIRHRQAQFAEVGLEIAGAVSPPKLKDRDRFAVSVAFGEVVQVGYVNGAERAGGGFLSAFASASLSAFSPTFIASNESGSSCLASSPTRGKPGSQPSPQVSPRAAD